MDFKLKGLERYRYLDDDEQNPVHEEPEEDVTEEEGHGVPLEEVEDGPGRSDAQHHALGERFHEHQMRAHGVPQLGPPRDPALEDGHAALARVLERRLGRDLDGHAGVLDGLSKEKVLGQVRGEGLHASGRVKDGLADEGRHASHAVDAQDGGAEVDPGEARAKVDL